MGGRLAALRAMPIWLPLRGRDYRMLWLGETISLVGDQFHFVALAWLTLELTGSGLALGSVLVAAGVPRAILLLFAGALADRRDPRSLLLVAHVARGVLVGALAALVLLGAASLPAVLVFAVAFGAVDALYLPAQGALLPRLVPAERLQPGNALLQSTIQLTTLLGPPAAGLAIAAVGTGPAFVLDALSFLVAGATVLFITTDPLPGSVAAEGAVRAARAEDGPAGDAPARGGPAGLVEEIRGGLAYVGRDTALRTLILLSLVFNLAFNGPIAVGLSWLADARFDAGPAGIGVLLAGWAAGGLVGTFVAGNLATGRRGLLLLMLAGGAGSGLAAIGLMPEIAPTVALLAGMGLAVAIVNIIAISWLQARVEPALIGRVMSIAMLASFASSPFSHALAGALVDVDATLMYLFAGGLVLATVSLGLLVRLPRLMDELPPRPVGDEEGERPLATSGEPA